MDLSIVMPTRNEAQRLPRTLDAIESFAAKDRRVIEVVIADDGSTDDTLTIAAAHAARQRIRLVPCHGARGVGAAVRRGVQAASGARVLVCDADGAVPFDDIAPLWAALDEGADIAVGSRAINRALIEVRQPPHRVLIGRVWGFVARRLANTGVRDTQCGFKLFGHGTAQEIFAAPTVTSFAFHIEVLLRARALGLRVVEVPVRWRDVAGSTIRLWRDPARMLVDLLGLAYHHRRERQPQP